MEMIRALAPWKDQGRIKEGSWKEKLEDANEHSLENLKGNNLAYILNHHHTTLSTERSCFPEREIL